MYFKAETSYPVFGKGFFIILKTINKSNYFEVIYSSFINNRYKGFVSDYNWSVLRKHGWKVNRINKKDLFIELL